MTHVLTGLFFVLLAAGWIYWLAGWWCSREYFRQLNGGRRAAGGDRQAPTVDKAPFLPSVSLLKPVKGLDAHVWENLVSFCQQSYPDFEILFGVAEASDPIVKLIRQLQASFPQVCIRLLIGADKGANPKAALLARLETHARGDVIVVSDSDIRVSNDYLRQVVAPLRDETVGLVTCPYRGVGAESLPARLESLYLDVTFLPAVMIADRLNAVLGLGATMAIRRHDLIAFGGYRSIADHLMDDYQVARAVRARGLRIHLSEVIVSSVLGNTGFAEQWNREVRWSRGIRTVQAGHLGLLVTFVTPVALAAACLANNLAAAGALAATLLLRWVVAWHITGWLRRREERRSLAWLPLRDVLSFLVWLSANFGSHVTWRGRRFRIGAGGELRAAPPASTPLKAPIRRLDAWLRRRQGIFEFSDDPRCILRAARVVCREVICLEDGTQVAPGDPLGELHLHNEHLPKIPRGGAGIAWAGEARRNMHHSLHLLAHAVTNDSRLAKVHAFRATPALVTRGGMRQMERVGSRLHFQRIDSAKSPGIWRRTHATLENILVGMLIWTFNPGGLRALGLRRERHTFWISRRMLIKKYGAVPTPGRLQPAEAITALSAPPGHEPSAVTAKAGIDKPSGSAKSRRRKRRKMSIGRR